MLISYIIQIRYYGIIVFLVVFFYSCKKKENEEKNSLVIDRSNYAEHNSKYLVKIYFNDKRYKIFRAYFDCIKSNREIDINSHRIKGCSKQLNVRQDTIKITFIPTVLGDHKFDEITIVYSDLQGNLKWIDTTFNYAVGSKIFHDANKSR